MKMAIANVKGQLPGEKSKAMLEQWHQYEADVVGYQAPVVWKKAKGCVVTDVDDNTYIDWTSGVLVTNVGHCHPHLVEATKKASDDLLNNYECCNTYRVAAAKKLVDALPPHMDKCFFLSTGSEAIEGALRLMKRYTGNFEVISFEGGFHGRTPGAASVGGLAGPKKKYGPTIPGTIRAPYPNPYRDPLGFCDDGPEFKKYFDFLEYTIATNSTGSLAGVIDLYSRRPDGSNACASGPKTGDCFSPSMRYRPPTAERGRCGRWNTRTSSPIFLHWARVSAAACRSRRFAQRVRYSRVWQRVR
jgi:4-aminobutyrate aminotransferase/(S)-3-amino-2-methylpropionate transaminase